MIAWDIETGPLDRELVLSRSKEFTAPEPPGDFNESTVKLGVMKDPAKIAAKIEAERVKHEKAVRDFARTTAEAKEKYETDVLEKAALSPLTGQVLAIGYKSEKGVAIKFAGTPESEADLISEFWLKYQSCNAPVRRMVGHNIFGFDLPFLVRRSWLLDVAVPQNLIDRDRFWNERVFVDTMKRWQCGVFGGEWVKLDALSQATGGSGKPDGITGAMFADLFNGSEEEKIQAIDYLKNDLEMTWNVAVALGVR